MARAVRRTCAMIAIGFAAGCGGGTSRTAPTAPAPPTQNAPAVSSLRIVLPTNSFSPGQTYQLRAELVLQDGGSRECAAEWSTDDARVATMSPSGVLNAVALGYVNVSAVCEGFSARVETKVAQRSPYRLVIAAVDSEVPTEFGVGAMMEFLDGGRAGEKVPAGAAIANGIPDIEWPVKVRFTAESYESRDFLLTEATGTRRNPISNLYDFWVPLKFVQDPESDTYVRRMSRTEMQTVHQFEMRIGGTVQIRTWWSVDYNDRLTVELWCAATLLRSIQQRFGSSGEGFTESVPTPGPCEVRLQQLKSDANTLYRVAIRYPH